MSLRSDITGVILAGGKSKRMGTDKALMPVKGLPSIQRVAHTLQTVFKDVIVVGPKKETYDFLKLPVFSDIYKECGPLGGIHAALFQSPTHSIFVTACDTPFISSRLIEYIMDFSSLAEVKIASVEGKLHPLCAVYSRSLLPILEEKLKSGNLTLQQIIHQLHSTVIPITSDLPFYTKNLLINLNDPTDYQAALKEE